VHVTFEDLGFWGFDVARLIDIGNYMNNCYVAFKN